MIAKTRRLRCKCQHRSRYGFDLTD